MPDFIAEPLPGYAPTEEDTRLRQAYRLFNDVLDKCSSSEAVSLRLSTCRNIFLTTNAVYVDLRDILRHGSLPSLLSRSIYEISRGQVLEAKKLVNELSKRLSFIADKISAWNDRVQLDNQFDNALDLLEQDERDTIRLILKSVITSDQSLSQHWGKQYLEITQDEHKDGRGWWELTIEIVSDLHLCYDVLRACLKATEEGDLFEDPERSFDVRIEIELGSSNIKALLTSLHRESLEGIILDEVVELAGRWFDDIYEKLRAFRINKAALPLPPPFVINLFPERASSAPIPVSSPVIVEVSLNCSPRNDIKIAFIDWAVPGNYMSSEDYSYSVPKRLMIGGIAKTAVIEAAKNDVNLLVFPEYFLPRSAEQSICNLASEYDIELIAGMEAIVQGSDILNEVIISLTGHGKPYRQTKVRAAVGERAIVKGHEVIIFHKSMIGNFAVLACSDLREQDVLSVIINHGLALDFIIVCSRNRATDQFETLAKADCSRFYCYVVVANARDDDDKKNAEITGSGIWSPKSREADMPLVASTVNIGVQDGEGKDVGLMLYSLKLDELIRDRRRYMSSYQPPPAWVKSLRY